MEGGYSLWRLLMIFIFGAGVKFELDLQLDQRHHISMLLSSSHPLLPIWYLFNPPKQKQELLIFFIGEGVKFEIRFQIGLEIPNFNVLLFKQSKMGSSENWSLKILTCHISSQGGVGGHPISGCLHFAWVTPTCLKFSITPYLYLIDHWKSWQIVHLSSYIMFLLKILIYKIMFMLANRDYIYNSINSFLYIRPSIPNYTIGINNNIFIKSIWNEFLIGNRILHWHIFTNIL